MTVVLDSWAVLRYLENTEPAATLVADLLDGERPLMSWINLGEVHYILRRSHGDDDATETVRDLRDVIDARLPDERLVLDAARLKADHPYAETLILRRCALPSPKMRRCGPAILSCSHGRVSVPRWARPLSSALTHVPGLDVGGERSSPGGQTVACEQLLGDDHPVVVDVLGHDAAVRDLERADGAAAERPSGGGDVAGRKA